jgi:hypothetical protein
MARSGAKPAKPAPARWSTEPVEDDSGPRPAYLGERIRRVALGLLAALVTARAFWPSEPDLKEGAGGGLSWVLALLAVAGIGIAAPFLGGTFRFRWSWTDALVIAVTVLVALSASHAFDRRAAINLAWEWVALGLAYLLLRNLPRTRIESSALAGVFVATAFAVSVYGLYQVTVELPLLRKEFQRNPQGILQKLSIEPGSRGEQMLKNRLMSSNEPWSTFALANSLAGYIVGALVLALAVAVYNLARGDAPGSRWVVLGMAAPVVLILLVCLLLTKSRSASIGVVAAMTVFAWRARRQVPERILLVSYVAALGVAGALVFAGIYTGHLDHAVLTQSPLSARYRWEYWQGAWGVITEGAPTLTRALAAPTFWWGVGPGNFAAPYLKHKLPESSEEILDPHNLFLEVWATAGIGALLALLAALFAGFWELLGPAGRTGGTAGPYQNSALRRRARRKAAALEGPWPDGDDEQDDTPPRSLTWLISSAAAGWALVVILGRLNPFEGDLFYRWLILGAAWLAAAFLGAPLWRRLPIPSLALGAAALAVVINLLAAGGIGIPTVALALWSILALGLNLRDDRSCSALREYESRTPAFILAVGWAALVGSFLGLVLPFWRAEAALAAAQAAILHRPPDYDAAEKACQRAIAADGYSSRPWLKSAEVHWKVWQEHGAKVQDLHWKTVPILYQMAASFPRNRNSWALHSERARVIRELLNELGTRLEPVEGLRYRAKIVEATRTASRLNPTNAELHARLADASAAIDMYQDAVTEAEAALRLDQITPHPDKKLPAGLRKHLEAQIARWSENAAKMPIKPVP